MFAAHVRAYGLIHEHQPNAIVHTNTSENSVYESNRLYIDVLLARSAGVSRDDLGAWIAEQRRAWYGAIAPVRAIERPIRRNSAAMSPIARLPHRYEHFSPRARRGSDDPEGVLRPLVEAVYSSAWDRTLDVLGIDYYDPVAANHMRLPGHRTAGGRSWRPTADLWDDVAYPAGLTEYSRANLALSAAALAGDRPLELWVVENGLCNRVRNGRSYERRDGWDRPRYLRENLAAVVRGLDEGLPIGAYLHWSLTDNYEWGSYQPRFGIHGVDRERGAKILPTDSMGRDSAAAYRRLIEGLRAGDRSVLANESPLP
jgi:hypothetical protein